MADDPKSMFSHLNKFPDLLKIKTPVVTEPLPLSTHSRIYTFCFFLFHSFFHWQLDIGYHSLCITKPGQL